MLLKQKILMSFSALCTVIGMTQASAVISMPDGWYVSGNVGRPLAVDKGASGGSSLKGLGFSAAFGYKFMPYLGMEMGYSWFGESTIKNSVGVKAYLEHNRSYHLALKAMLPVDITGLEFFAKLGAQRLSSNLKNENASAAALISPQPSSHTTTGVFMGVGGSYYFTPQLAMSLEWQRAKGNSSVGIFDLYSVGLVYLIG